MLIYQFFLFSEKPKDLAQQWNLHQSMFITVFEKIHQKNVIHYVEHSKTLFSKNLCRCTPNSRLMIDSATLLDVWLQHSLFHGEVSVRSWVDSVNLLYVLSNCSWGQHLCSQQATSSLGNRWTLQGTLRTSAQLHSLATSCCLPFGSWVCPQSLFFHHLQLEWKSWK